MNEMFNKTFDLIGPLKITLDLIGMLSVKLHFIGMAKKSVIVNLCDGHRY